GPSAPVANTTAPADPNKIVTVETNAPRQVDAHPEDQTPPPAVTTNTPKPAAPEPVKPAPAAAEPAAAPAGRFAVNLGIYADEAHANALVGKVKKLGFGAYSEPTE